MNNLQSVARRANCASLSGFLRAEARPEVGTDAVAPSQPYPLEGEVALTKNVCSS